MSKTHENLEQKNKIYHITFIKKSRNFEKIALQILSYLKLIFINHERVVLANNFQKDFLQTREQHGVSVYAHVSLALLQDSKDFAYLVRRHSRNFVRWETCSQWTRFASTSSSSVVAAAREGCGLQKKWEWAILICLLV